MFGGCIRRLTFYVTMCLLIGSINPSKRYQDMALKQHNLYRARHGTAMLIQTDELNDLADRCSMYYARKRKIDHSCSYKSVNPKYNGRGENLYSMGPSWMPSKDAWTQTVGATYAWYSEIKNYDFATRSYSGVVGHFTQAIWRSSRELGCGYARAGDFIAVACLYWPPGNVVGMEKGNILPPTNRTPHKRSWTADESEGSAQRTGAILGLLFLTLCVCLVQ